MKKKLSSRLLDWMFYAALVAIPVWLNVDIAREIIYMNEKIDEAAQLSAFEIIRGKNYLDNHDYDTARLCGARARTKFYDWEDIPTEYPLIKPIIYFLNKSMIDDLKGAGMHIEFEAIDKKAKRKFRRA